MIEVDFFGSKHYDAWADVLRAARNDLFLYDRNFIEYHGDRFVDCSMIAYADGVPVSVFPAARGAEPDLVVSHPGLTFGGFVFRKDLRSELALEVIDAYLDRMRSAGVRELLVKLLPAAFAKYPSQEAEYALWRRGFRLSRRDLSSMLPLRNGLAPNRSRNQQIAKAVRAGVSRSEENLAAFYGLLCDALSARHGVAPVHSLAELVLLRSRFADEIALRLAELEGTVVAGVLLFRYGHIWHTQYLASSPVGRNVGALDLAIAGVIEEAQAAGAEALSFGTSTTSEGRELNRGLLWQKESFGARSITHDMMRGVL